MMKFGAIGCGNMASAILRGIAAGMPGRLELYGTDLDPAKLEALSDTGVSPLSSAADVARECDMVLLSVKPQVFPSLAAELREAAADKAYLSIMAGISADAIREALSFPARLCMIMPNTPLMLGAGATAMACDGMTEEEFALAREIFSCAGKVVEIPADKMNAVIPLNGSSPAFIYEFAKGFLRYGKEAGFSDEVALTLFCQSLRGAAEMMERSGYDVDTLIQMVSSKGGTTIAGLSGLSDGRLQQAIDLCCHRCVQRAEELAAGR